jgi:hypothetical protein
VTIDGLGVTVFTVHIRRIMQTILLFATLICIGVLVYLKIKDEHPDCYDINSFLGKALHINRRFKPEECTVAHLLRVIPDRSGYSNRYVEALAGIVPYTDLEELERVHAAVAEFRPYLFGAIQAGDSSKPIF